MIIRQLYYALPSALHIPVVHTIRSAALWLCLQRQQTNNPKSRMLRQINRVPRAASATIVMLCMFALSVPRRARNQTNRHTHRPNTHTHTHSQTGNFLTHFTFFYGFVCECVCICLWCFCVCVVNMYAILCVCCTFTAIGTCLFGCCRRNGAILLNIVTPLKRK